MVDKIIGFLAALGLIISLILRGRLSELQTDIEEERADEAEAQVNFYQRLNTRLSNLKQTHINEASLDEQKSSDDRDEFDTPWQ